MNLADWLSNKLSRLLSVDLKRFIGFASWTFLDQSYLMALTLVQGIILARHLGPKGFGFIALIITATNLVKDIFEARTSEVLTRFGTRHLENNKNLAGAVAKLSWLIDGAMAILMVSLLMVAAPILSNNFIKLADGAFFIRLNAVTLLLLWGVSVGGVILRMAERYHFLALQNMINNTIRFMIVVIFVFSNAELEWLFYGYILSAVVKSILSWSFSLSAAGYLFGPNWWKTPINALKTSYSEIIRFSLVKNFSELIRIVGRRGNMLALGYFGTPEMAGQLKIALNLVSLLEFPITPMYNAASVEVARLWHDNLARLRSLLLRLTAISSLAGFLGFLVLAIFGEQIIHLCFGDHFATAAKVLPYLALALALRLTTIFLSPILSVGSSPKLLMITSLTTNGINLVALLICVPLYDLMGIGYAENITSMGVILTLVIVARKTWIGHTKEAAIIT